MPGTQESRANYVDSLLRKQRQLHPECLKLDDGNSEYFDKLFSNIAHQCLENVELKMSRCTEIVLDSVKNQRRNQDDLHTDLSYLENYSMQSFRNKTTKLFESDFDRELFQPFTGKTDPLLRQQISHRTALRLCHTDLVNFIDLKGTTFLDELIVQNTVSESDALSITEIESKKARNEAFLRLVQSSFSLETFLGIFIPAVSKHCSEKLATELQTVLCTGRQFQEEVKCNICKVKEIVEPRLLADNLYRSNLIPPVLHSDLRGGALSNDVKWEKLLKGIRDPRDILDCLRDRCEAVYNDLDLANCVSFNCRCHDIVYLANRAAEMDEFDVSVDSNDIAKLSDLDSCFEAQSTDTFAQSDSASQGTDPQDVSNAAVRQQNRVEYTYDAFVVYNDQDGGFIRTRVLPMLEEELGYRLCVLQRDFLPGRSFEDDISQFIRSSRAVIFLLSPAFMECAWCDFQVALVTAMVINREIKLIPIVVKNILPSRWSEGAKMLRSICRCVVFPDNPNQQDKFWRCVARALE